MSFMQDAIRPDVLRQPHKPQEETQRHPLALAAPAVWFERLETRQFLSASPLTDPLLINQDPGDQHQSVVAVAPDGSFVVVWQDAVDGDGNLFYRRFDAEGQPLGDAGVVNPAEAALVDDGRLEAAADPGVPGFIGRIDVAIDQDGNFVIVWTSGVNGDLDVFARLFQSTGDPSGEAFVVHADTNGDQHSASVAMDADGDFVVAWLSNVQVNVQVKVNPPAYFYEYIDYDTGRKRRVTYDPPAFNESRSYDVPAVFARRFDAAGAAQNDEFRVSDAATNNTQFSAALSPDVAMDDDGDFVVAFATADFKAGKKLIEPAYTDYYVYYDDNDRPINLFFGQGDYFSYDPQFTGGKIVVKRYNAAGEQQGGPITAVTRNSSVQRLRGVRVAMDADGDIVVGGIVDQYKKQVVNFDGYMDEYDVFVRSQLVARRVSNAGKTQGSELKVADPGNSLFIRRAAVDMDADGNFIWVWKQEFDDSLQGNVVEVKILARRYDALGKLQGDSFRIDGADSLATGAPSVGFDGGGNFVVAWNAQGEEALDIFARIFQPPRPDLTGAITAVTLPPGVVLGNSVAGRVTVQVQNIGDAAFKGAIDIQIVASLNDIFGDEDDFLIGFINGKAVNLAAVNGSTSVPINVNTNLIDVDAPGEYRILAKIDSGNHVNNELSEDNNVAEADLRIMAADPFNDLAALLLTASGPGEIFVPGDLVRVTLRLINQGNIAVVNQNVTIRYFATLSGEIDDGAIEVAVLADQKLTLNPGQTRDLSGSFRITGDVPVGEYFLAAVIESAFEETSLENNIVVSAASSQVAWFFGSFGGRRNVKLSLLADNGATMTFTLKGLGVGEVLSMGGLGFDVNITDTVAASAVTITSKDGPGLLHDVRVGEEGTPFDLKTFTASTSNLLGNMLFSGMVGTIKLNNVADAHHLDIRNGLGSGSAVTMVFGRVEDLFIDSAIAIKSLTVTDWLNGGEVKAPSLAKLTVKGDAKNGIAGNLQANLALDGSDGAAQTLGKTVIAGALGPPPGAPDEQVVLWNIIGNVAAVTIGAASSWNLNVEGGIQTLTLNNATQNLNLVGQWIRTFRAKNDVSNSTFTFSLPPDPKNLAVNAFTVDGAAQGLLLNSAGNVRTFTAGKLIDSQLRAGVKEALPSGELPDSLDDFEDLSATITTVNIKGVKGEDKSVATFINSIIAAYTLGKMSLNVVDTANDVNQGVTFGLAARAIAQVLGQKVDGTKFPVLKNLDELADVPGDFDFEAFELRPLEPAPI